MPCLYKNGIHDTERMNMLFNYFQLTHVILTYSSAKTVSTIVWCELVVHTIVLTIDIQVVQSEVLSPPLKP